MDLQKHAKTRPTTPKRRIWEEDSATSKSEEGNEKEEEEEVSPLESDHSAQIEILKKRKRDDGDLEHVSSLEAPKSKKSRT